jgi:predicted GNAT family N-acyltransferase
MGKELAEGARPDMHILPYSPRRRTSHHYPMHVRDYIPADHAACMAVFDSNVPDFFLLGERTEFSAFLGVPTGPYLLVEARTGAVVACGGHAIEPGTGNARLCWGMVRHDLHGTGLGGMLLETRLNRIRSEGLAAVVELGTTQNTYPFFERYGFHTVSVEPDGYGPGLDRYEMRLSLSAGTGHRDGIAPAP